MLLTSLKGKYEIQCFLFIYLFKVEKHEAVELGLVKFSESNSRHL